MRNPAILAIVFFLFFHFLIFAQPDLSKPLGPTIADTGSSFYSFETTIIASQDGKRRYKIMIGVPKTNPPKEGYPVIYMLDGNSALASIHDEMLEKLEEKPVIVAIGYDTELRFDVEARAYDYTPAMPDDSEPNIELA